MDFIGPFPSSHGYDYIRVIVCHLTSMVHLILVNTTNTADELAMIYLREVVRLHGLPKSIVSDRDSKFTSKFWRELHRLMGVKLLIFPNTSNYVLDLPPELKDRHIHLRFHVSLLRKHEANDNALFPQREAHTFYDFGADDSAEWLVDEIVGHEWPGQKCQFHVRWMLGDNTWEPYEHCKDLAALDEYCCLMGVKSWRSLPHKK
ncbi:hypothetical protein TRAPUB_1279 [Trametes pubescens]|uniref:Integrase catalytic domain-containing protein n=1 Tax=Trametes pubescens TaxID=154538 RepID=A0A1M2VJP9_TRAPU|nr:hypothetical protein TRAPUB_1279 [Trametes pubescens]